MTEISNSIYIDTQLQLRALNPDDSPALFALIDTNREYLARFLPWVEDTLSINDSLGFINKSFENYANNIEYNFGIFYQDRLVGMISIRTANHLGAPLEIGYWIAEAYSGKGITTQATDAITKYGFDQLGLSQISIFAQIDNPASNKIAKKIDYQLIDSKTKIDGKIINHWIKYPPPDQINPK
ncbi:GNAT family N-acetyltransferase [Candidatus Saccharibacteria bacterium]|nr:GNAT family N-acetyltransferase [Candidatus Saccharibacteria bacterium]